MILRPRPSLDAPGAWLFPKFTTHVLANGLKVSTSHIPGKPVLGVELRLPRTTGHDPAGQEGLAALAAAMLDEGTARHDAEEFAEALDLIGASWGAGASSTGTSAGVEVPAGNLAEALSLLADAVTTPTVPEKEHGMVVAQTLNILKSQYADPSARARLAHLTSIWDETSRAALPGTGTPGSVSSITRDDTAALLRGLSPHGAHLYVAGDLTGTDVVAAAEAAFGGWDTPAAGLEVPGIDVGGVAPRLIVVDRPGSVQTELVLGTVAPTRTSPAWSALQVGSHVLGGTLTSRIDMLLREEKGYTYGMRAGLEPRPRTGSWKVSGSVDTPSTLPAVTDLLQLLRDVRGGVTAAEVEASAAYLVGVSPLRWESPSGVVSQAAALEGSGLGPEWIDGYLAGMAAASAADVDEALSLLPLEALSVVAVGDAEKITAGLETETGMRAEVVAE